MDILQAMIQGIVQGLTEFLPISSSGHLSLAKHFMGIEVPSILFDVMLHLGTLIAVFVVYYKLIWRLLKELVFTIRDIVTGKFKWSEMNADRNLLMMLIIGLIPLFLLFVPIPGTGMQIKDFADLWATDSSIILEGCALLVTSVLLTLGIVASKKQVKKAEELTKQGRRGVNVGRRRFNVIDAVCVGVAQCAAAVFPGLSRSGSTLATGLMRGINRQAALDYSFVLGMPAILAAAVLSLKDAATENVSIDVLPLIAGMVSAAVVGFLAIKLLKWMVSSNRLGIFAWYTAIVGLAVLVIGIIEQNTGVNLFTGMPL